VSDSLLGSGTLRALVSLISAGVAYTSAAYATSVIAVPVTSAGDVFIKYAWVGFISLAGWAANSLPVLADWGEGTPRRRLVIVQGVVQAFFFGFGAFWASSGAGQNIMASYLAAAGAAYAGDRYFTFGRREPSEPTGPGPAEGAK
jgi:hypothetical protein